MFGSSPKFQADARSAIPERGCDHPDCDEAGEHRAPRSRDNLDSFYWFCVVHARRYNAAWNFFGDMNQREIEDYQKAALTWHRPTWPLGGEQRLKAAMRRGNYNDPYGVIGEDEAAGGQDAAYRRMPAEERQALAVLNLPGTATDGDIKARYKELVKRLHPDVNGDDEQAVGQLKIVIEAHRVLAKRSGG